MYPYKLVLVASMPRSGSMWTFNVVRDMFRHLGTEVLPEEVPYLEQVNLQIAEQAVNDPAPAGMHVLKTHQPVNVFPQARFIATHRDVRDAMISFMRFMDFDFERGLEAAAGMADLSDHFRRFPDDVARQVEYSDIKARPLETANSLATFLGLNLPGPALEAIVAKYAKESVRALIETMERGVDTAEPVTEPTRQAGTVLLPGNANARALDVATGFQSGHVSDYQDGDWQALLTAEQKALVEERLGAWLDRHGY